MVPVFQFDAEFYKGILQYNLCLNYSNDWLQIMKSDIVTQVIYWFTHLTDEIYSVQITEFYFEVFHYDSLQLRIKRNKSFTNNSVTWTLICLGFEVKKKALSCYFKLNIYILPVCIKPSLFVDTTIYNSTEIIDSDKISAWYFLVYLVKKVFVICTFKFCLFQVNYLNKEI